MARIIGALLLLACLALPVTARAQDRMTVEAGGQTYDFTATGTWEPLADGPHDARRIWIWAEHEDGTAILLDLAATGSRVDEILFRFIEPETPDFVSREWAEGQGFRVMLDVLRPDGPAVVVEGRFRGPLIETGVPASRGRIAGSFALRLVEPIYSPN